MTNYKKTNKNHGFSQSEVEAIKDQGRKLGLLLEKSNLPLEVKQELVALIEVMSLKQIEKLINALEAQFLVQSTKKIDAKYKQELEMKIKEFEKEKEILQTKFSNKMNKFLGNIKT